MARRDALAADVRRLCGPFTSEVVQLAAELKAAIESAHALLAPVADRDEEAALAFQILADALASAEAPPPGETGAGATTQHPTER